LQPRDQKRVHTNHLDEVLLDEDIGGFVGMFLFDSVDDIIDNSNIMKDILKMLKT
jgi:hypothetical protein